MWNKYIQFGALKKRKAYKAFNHNISIRWLTKKEECANWKVGSGFTFSSKTDKNIRIHNFRKRKNIYECRPCRGFLG
jgi:hypothetical protein